MKCVDLIYKDLYRVGGGNLIRSYFTFPGFKYLCVFRLIQSFKEVWYLKPIVFFLKVKLIMMQRKYGILIPARCTIGEGFFIGHLGTIVVNEKVKIGSNVNISQGVTIGQLNRGKRMGTPVIGNEVYIGPGAKILGNIVVGNNVAIGANAVVLDDVPDNVCVAGIPAKIVSMNGSDGYVNRKV